MSTRDDDSRAAAGPRSSPLLSVVVPVHNEEDNVAPLVAEIDAALAGDEALAGAFEMVFVDDGSADATGERLRESRMRFDRLRVIRHAACAGQSAAICTGVRHARGGAVATLDGDGQNDPADIPGLFARWRGDADPPMLLVAGLRAKRRDTWIKRRSSRIANGVRARMLGDRTPDTGCGLKVFGRETFLRLPAFDHMHRFLPALVLRAGGRVVSVPVNHRPRQRGRSKYGTLDRLAVGIVDLLGVMWLQRRARLAAVEARESDTP